MASRAARLAELRALRASGKTRASTYRVEEEDQLYDEVDDDQYKRIVRDRLDQDDFVVDDNGQGYVDDGREEWDVQDGASGTESEEEANYKKKSKRKRDDQKVKEEITNGINKYFTAKAASKPSKPKAVATAEDDAFMANLLGEVDVNIPAQTYVPPKKHAKLESRHRARMSPPPPPMPTMVKRERVEDPMDIDVENRFGADDDIILHDTDEPVPIKEEVAASSSPTTNGLKTELEAITAKLEEDDDEMEAVQVVGHSNYSSKVNISAKRPTSAAPAQATKPVLSNNVKEVADPAVWTTVADKLTVVGSTIQTDAPRTTKLSPEKSLEEDKTLLFFWTDFAEVAGSLCLFGKVKNRENSNYSSGFVKIDNILRKLYFLPRQNRQRSGKDTDGEVTMSDVYNEVDEIMSRLHVGTYKIKTCTRKYAFELPSVPKEADYLKVLYPYNRPIFPVQSGETFSHVFGTNTPLFEQFVLFQHIMGPCWLKIRDANFQAVTNASWCSLELQVSDPKNVTPCDFDMEPPTLTLMTISLRTTYNSSLNKQELLVACGRVYENVALNDSRSVEKIPSKLFTIIRPAGEGYPMGFKLEASKQKGMVGMERNETAVLSKFIAIVGNIDPDVIVGHKLDDFDINTLLHRMREKKTPGWHRIGRLRRSEWPKGSFFARQLCAGRLLCDMGNEMGKSLMLKCQSWELSEMCNVYLGEKRTEIDVEQALKTWAMTRDGLMNFIRHCEVDTHYITALAMKMQMLPLTKQLTNLAGNAWARTLSGSRADRNEYILLHEFYRNKYICPDKASPKGKAPVQDPDAEEGEGAESKKKDKYKGGLVFEPEKGLYDRFILVMDFNSLYPSIIQEFNICFTTVDRADLGDDEKVPDVPADQALGILPRLISTLVNRRREVKKLMKHKNATADQLAVWETKQMALKLTANSMYGCLGFTKSRFYARPLAMLTTFKGREILQSTKELAESQSLRVVYGDTDSVMINTNVDNIQDALKVGRDFKKLVNDRYKLLEIDIDNVFRRLLLHAKKKYAAINMVEIDGKFTEKLEVKGLDMRRREYCQLSKEASQKLLNFLLSGDDPEQVIESIHEYLRDLSKKMRNFEIPAQKYTIFTQLGKDPKDYGNSSTMPAVQVALKLMAKGKHVRAKDVMSFIITGTNDGSNDSAAKSAHPMEEVIAKGSELKPDIEYYLHKQILPPVERLCAPISGTDITRLADCLGLDSSKYRVHSTARRDVLEDEMQPLESQIPDSVRFKDATPLQLRCARCRARTEFAGILASSEAMTHDGLVCAGCNAVFPTLAVAAQLETQLRQHIARFYAAWVVCDDADCGHRTRTITCSVYGRRCLGPKGLASGCAGRMRLEHSEKMLYNQLLFYSGMFDAEKAREGLGSATDEVKGEKGDKLKVVIESNRERFDTLRGVVKGYLERNGHHWVQMDSLFAFAFKA